MLLVNSAELGALTRRVCGFRRGGRERQRTVAATGGGYVSMLASSLRTIVAGLQFQTAPAIAAAAAGAGALALSGKLALGGEELVSGVAGMVFSGVPTPGLLALRAASFVAVEYGPNDGG